MYISFVHHHRTMCSILLFIVLFYGMQVIHPAFLFHPDGSLRDFGVGYRNKTIMPMWLFSLVLGLMSYVVCMSCSYTLR